MPTIGKKLGALLASVLLASTLGLVACGGQASGDAKEMSYTSKDLNVYREKDVVDGTVAIRFYESTPNVPYIGVKQYYKEFFSTDYSMEEDDGVYTFKNADGGGYIFDTRLDDVTITDIKTFDADPNFVTTTSKTFLSETGSSSSTMHDKIISLKSYGIDIHGDKDDAYVPLTLLSNFSGGPQFYQVAYNGKDIYVLDMMGVMYPGEKRDTQYFKDTYYKVIGDVAASRPEDLAKYSYNQLCLSFDNERGYTSQLVFGDNNLLTLGLDGILELYHPTLKERLLSTDKLDYYSGYLALSGGLYDGGHTSILMIQDPSGKTDDPLFITLSDQLKNDEDLTGLVKTFIGGVVGTAINQATYQNARNAAFGFDGGTAGVGDTDAAGAGEVSAAGDAASGAAAAPAEDSGDASAAAGGAASEAAATTAEDAASEDAADADADSSEDEEDKGFYYHFDEATKTAYIGFNKFAVDYVAWDEFYAEGKEAQEAPVETDSYAFVRSSMYQAKADGAKYLVLDLSTNGGGDEAALCGIMGLFNKAGSSMAFNNVMHRGRSTTDYGVDINLDGECDAADVAEAEGFDFKVAVLTSKCSFSCGNLLPSLMKEAGYKIVGEQSGGGSCAVTYEFTADGLPYVRSSYSCLSNERGDNIDTGVPLDYDIAKELGGLSREEAAPHFYDAKLISTYLEGAYQ